MLAHIRHEGRAQAFAALAENGSALMDSRFANGVAAQESWRAQSWTNEARLDAQSALHADPRVSESKMGEDIVRAARISGTRSGRGGAPEFRFDDLDVLVGGYTAPSFGEAQRGAYSTYVNAQKERILQESYEEALKYRGTYAKGSEERRNDLTRKIEGAREAEQAALHGVEDAVRPMVDAARDRCLWVLGESPDGRSNAEIWAHRVAVGEYLAERAERGAPEARGLGEADLDRYRDATDQDFRFADARQARARHIMDVAAAPAARLDARWANAALREANDRVNEATTTSADRDELRTMEDRFPQYFADTSGDPALRSAYRELVTARASDISGRVYIDGDSREVVGGEYEVRPNAPQQRVSQLIEDALTSEPGTTANRYMTQVYTQCERVTNAEPSREGRPGATTGFTRVEPVVGSGVAQSANTRRPEPGAAPGVARQQQPPGVGY